MDIIINPKYNFLRRYLEKIPAEFNKHSGEVLYESRNLLQKEKVQDIELVVKSFKEPKLLNRIVYTYFRKSKALRSYQHSEILLNHGIFAPDPIACIIEYRNKLISNSYYINRYEDAKTVRDLMDGQVTGNEEVLNAFTSFIIKVHQNGIFHLDLSPGNILIRQDTKYNFYLIDVNRMRFHSSINLKTVCYNFRRLCTSREVLRYIARKYATEMNWDPERMIAQSERDSDDFFRKFFFHRAATRSKAKGIRFIILRFRLSRILRHQISKSSAKYQHLFDIERHIYQTYLIEYDFRKIYTEEYI